MKHSKTLENCWDGGHQQTALPFVGQGRALGLGDAPLEARARAGSSAKARSAHAAAAFLPMDERAIKAGRDANF